MSQVLAAVQKVCTNDCLAFGRALELTVSVGMPWSSSSVDLCRGRLDAGGPPSCVSPRKASTRNNGASWMVPLDPDPDAHL